jgi:hypothetical protein
MLTGDDRNPLPVGFRKLSIGVTLENNLSEAPDCPFLFCWIHQCRTVAAHSQTYIKSVDLLILFVIPFL